LIRSLRAISPTINISIVFICASLVDCGRIIRHPAIKNSSSAGLAFYSFPRADSLLKTRRETRTVRFIRVCRCVDIRQIDSARSHVCFALWMSRQWRQTSLGWKERPSPTAYGRERNSSCDTVGYIQLARSNRAFGGELRTHRGPNKNGTRLRAAWLSYERKRTATFTFCPCGCERRQAGLAGWATAAAPITALRGKALAKWLPALLVVALTLLVVALTLLVVALILLVVALILLVLALTLLVLTLARWLLATLVALALARWLLADLQAQRVVASDATEPTPRPTTLLRRWAKWLPQTSANASTLDGVVPSAHP
jgi:hypothetical protein